MEGERGVEPALHISDPHLRAEPDRTDHDWHPLSAQILLNPQPALMDRQAEIAFALSACPPSVANKAAVYGLENQAM